MKFTTGWEIGISHGKKGNLLLQVRSITSGCGLFKSGWTLAIHSLLNGCWIKSISNTILICWKGETKVIWHWYHIFVYINICKYPIYIPCFVAGLQRSLELDIVECVFFLTARWKEKSPAFHSKELSPWSTRTTDRRERSMKKDPRDRKRKKLCFFDVETSNVFLLLWVYDLGLVFVLFFLIMLFFW